MKRLAAAPREATPSQARALWTDLLARLWLAQVACEQEQTKRELHALGLRRTGTAATILNREAALACRMAASFGVDVRPLEVQRRIGELACPAPLVSHLHGLVEAYRRIEFDPASPVDGARSLWLSGRQRVHLAQISTFEVIAERHQGTG